MQFSLVDEKRVVPRPKLRGTCPYCGAETVAKCGSVKVWHWAHVSRHECDQWWESETEWHRNWKSNFPENWRERIEFAIDGEKHVADIKTPKGYTIEFQHSHIEAAEREQREAFHKKLIWVVDGLRLKRDRSTFFDHLDTKSPSTSKPRSYELNYRVPQILRRWADSRTHVYFDFGQCILWEMPPQRGVWQAYISPVLKSEFIEAISDGRKPMHTSNVSAF